MMRKAIGNSAPRIILCGIGRLDILLLRILRIYREIWKAASFPWLFCY